MCLILPTKIGGREKLYALKNTLIQLRIDKRYFVTRGEIQGTKTQFSWTAPQSNVFFTLWQHRQKYSRFYRMLLKIVFHCLY